MPFLPVTASFPKSRPGVADRGTSAAPTPATSAHSAPTAHTAPTAHRPAWAKPHVSWPFLAVVPLTARRGEQGPASFTV
jgi:hypothetical protein